MSITFAHCLRNFRPSKHFWIRFDFLHFRIRCMHFDRKGRGIWKKNPENRLWKYRTQCAMALTLDTLVISTTPLYTILRIHSLPLLLSVFLFYEFLNICGELLSIASSLRLAALTEARQWQLHKIRNSETHIYMLAQSVQRRIGFWSSSHS